MRIYDLRAFNILEIKEMIKGYRDCKIVLTSQQYQKLPSHVPQLCYYKNIFIELINSELPQYITWSNEDCVSNLDFSSLSNQWHISPTAISPITSSFVGKISKNIGLPHSVNFVEKHKRTTLVWKISFNGFETTKSEAHDEKFDYLYGFLMAYFKRVHQGESKTQIKKYLNTIVYPMTKKEQTAFLQGIFYENCGLRFKEAKEYLEKIKVKK